MESLFIGKHIIRLESVDSTNNYATAAIKSGEASHGSLIYANFQEKGKGQRLNSWESEKGKNLLLSYVLTPNKLPSEKSFELNFICSLAVKDFVSHLAIGHTVNIKWPNDIMLNGKKVAGVLIENALQSGKLKFSILGIGLNMNQKEFSYPSATSILKETKNVTDLELAISLLSSYLEKWYLKLEAGKLNDLILEYNSFLWKKNVLISAVFKGESTKLKLLNVDRFGLVQLEKDGEFYKADFSELKIGYE